MFPLLLTLVLSSPEVPAACQAPPTRDVGALSKFAQASGSLSVGLDSIATWCFDSTGAWSGGQPGKPSIEPVGDCKKAITACEIAKSAMVEEQRTTMFSALADIERPFLGVKYKPKRSGLAQRPPEIADCHARERSMLFAQAQSRMDVARLASQTQSEYGNYKTWLFSEGLKCAEAMARGEKDYLQKRVAIDTPTPGGGTQQVPKSSSPLPSGEGQGEGKTAAQPVNQKTLTIANPSGMSVIDAGLPQANQKTLTIAPPGGKADAGLLQVLQANQKMLTIAPPGGNADAGTKQVAINGLAGTNGGTASNGATGSNTAVSTSTPPTSKPPVAGTATFTVPLGGPTAERERALASSMLEKWRYFLAEQSKIEQDSDWVSGFLASRELRDCRCQRQVPGEVVRRIENKDHVDELEVDDEKNTRCEICLLDSYPKWKTRVVKQCSLSLELSDFELGVLQRSDDGNGLPPRCIDAAKARLTGKTPAMVTTQQQQQQRAGNTYLITHAPEPQQPAPEMLKPADYAPIPAREAGRIYVRIFTSSACIAEVLPGPIQARTGDLLPIPPQATEITVRGACGGFAEVYFGKEEKPRVSETFARNQPLRLQFRAP